VHGGPRLEPLHPNFNETRESLHALAEHVLAAARYAAVGRIGLVPRGRGIATPPYPEPRGEAERELFVERDWLHRRDGGAVLAARATTIRAAAEFAQVEPGAPPVYPAVTPLDVDAPLRIDADAALRLGDWFAFGAAVLGAHVAGAGGDAAPTLWPEHFDLAVDFGPDGAHANYGASPGDSAIAEPYLYVGPWDDVREHEYWNATSFRGAVLPYSDLVGDDGVTVALGFLRRGYELLLAGV
jgi:hypothetical protein